MLDGRDGLVDDGLPRTALVDIRILRPEVESMTLHDLFPGGRMRRHTVEEHPVHVKEEGLQPFLGRIAALAKDGRADPHHGATARDSNPIVIRHPHGEIYHLSIYDLVIYDLVI